jgi:hypothetical protein
VGLLALVQAEPNAYGWCADDQRQILATVRFVSAEPLLGPVAELNSRGSTGSSRAARAEPNTADVTRYGSTMIETGALPKAWPLCTSRGAVARRKPGDGCSTDEFGMSCRRRRR